MSIPHKPRRLFWDIETSPNIGFFWKAGFKLNIGPENIIKERAIICIAWKWEGEDEVHVLSWDQFRSDKALIKAFLKVAAEADELVAHNGDRYDIRWFRTRCLFHGITTLPKFKTVDTLAWVKQLFHFNSNKLDYIAKYLGVSTKLYTGFNLWKKVVLDNDREALAEMCRYCQQDVRVVEAVWQKLRLMAPLKTHAGVQAGEPKWTCPHDGSTNVRVDKYRYTAGGARQVQMQCKDCGSYYQISDAAHKLYVAQKPKRKKNQQ